MDGNRRKNGTFEILKLAVFLYFLSLFRCRSGCAESVVMERKIRNTTGKMSGKRADIRRRKKSEVCTDIQKHSRGKTEYVTFCIYKIIYERQFNCQAYRLCVKYEKSQKFAQKSFRLFCSDLKQKSRNFAWGLIRFW